MAYRAVIFDLDGTLLDTLEDIGDAANRVLAGRGFPTHPVDSYRDFIGDGAGRLIMRALPPDHRQPETLQGCLKDFGAAYARNWNVKSRPYPGIPELLSALLDRGVLCAVLSNKPEVFTVQCVSELLSAWTFPVVMGAVPERPHKPDPQGAREAARRLEVDPSQVLYVGDTVTDMQTALAAGMLPLGVSWGFRPAAELTAHGARAILEKPLDLLPWLDHPPSDQSY